MNDTRTNTKRIRGYRLQKIREEHFSENPLCVMCQAQGRTTIATDLDHIVPLYKGGKDEPENRQGLCTSCHEVKTRRDMGQSVKGCGPDGIPVDDEHPWNKM